jgi:uncharacterized membrane protein YjgN (DUF898 family)
MQPVEPSQQPITSLPPFIEPREPRPVLSFRYEGTGGGLFLLAMKNLLLTLVTFGIYLPWARTARRKYLWQNIDVGGHRLRYHGTGVELFIGYLKVAGVYFLFFGLPALVTLASRVAGMAVQLTGFVVLFFLVIPIAIFGSRRYRLSRTSLRGVRFGLDPGAGGFVKLFVVTQLLTICTLGVYGPVAQNRLHQYLTWKSRYGSEPFVYDAPDREAWRIVILGMIFSILTLGIYYPWYIATFAKFRMAHTMFQGARGRLDLTGLDVLKILLLAMFGTILTLGIAVPWITTYVLRTITEKLTFVGAIDFARVEGRAAEGSAAADDLASALDVGFEV